MVKKDGIKLLLTEQQYCDPNMQELIKSSEGVEIITNEKFEEMLMESFSLDDLVNEVVN